ncbi:protein transporter Sec31 [Streptomyces sp. NPDC051079]|uniref:protein transporter Sec31 n=1 Tax=Streptomyces sp. NPDC051079 TaxID=3155043 RepID=UPI00344B643B
MRTRTIVQTRKVPHTIDGKTVMVDDQYAMHVPVPPRDWDHTVRNAVTGAAAGIGFASIGWSTASIGGLLDRVVISPAAYAAAGVFDLVWISCMALEWLARHDPARAALPRRAGWAALVVAMAAVGVDGYVEGQLVIGIVGATVSGLAKGLWTVVLAHHAHPLDPRTQQWVDAQRAEAGVRLAMIPIRRELTRADGLVAAEEAAIRTSPDAGPDSPDDSGDDQDAEVLPLPPGAVTAKDAVRTAWEAGFRDEDAIRRTASTALGRPLSPDTVARYVRALKVGA